eukprot:13733793-Alexandrium_andersonii.AAC.1
MAPARMVEHRSCMAYSSVGCGVPAVSCGAPAPDGELQRGTAELRLGRRARAWIASSGCGPRSSG